MVTPAAHDNLALTGVRTHSIYAVKASGTWFAHTAAFIDVYNKVRESMKVKRKANEKSNFLQMSLLHVIVVFFFFLSDFQTLTV